MISRDLIVLVADADTKQAIEGILSRPLALGIRPLTSDVFAHPQHDPACRLRADGFLRAFTARYSHALVVFDREGCGHDALDRTTLEAEVERSLSVAGWQDRAAAIVIDPELEVWVWSDSPHVDAVLGWRGRRPALREWMRERSILRPSAVKPDRPKEAMDLALLEVRRPRSASRFAELAKTVSLERCTDPAFVKMKQLLRTWFRPASSA